MWERGGGTCGTFALEKFERKVIAKKLGLMLALEKGGNIKDYDGGMHGVKPSTKWGSELQHKESTQKKKFPKGKNSPAGLVNSGLGEKTERVRESVTGGR